MRTHDLIAVLVQNLSPVQANAVGKRLSRAQLQGLTAGTVVLVGVFGVSSDMPEQILTPGFWLRLAFPLAVIAAAVKLVERLVRPGVAVAWAWLMTMLPIVTMMMGTILFILTAPPEFRLKLVSSTSLWSTTIGNTMLLSLASFIAMIHAMKGLAPTRLALTGAAAGLLAGAQGVLIYALYCPDMPVPYWSALQIAAMFMTTAIGAILGPICIRW